MQSGSIASKDDGTGLFSPIMTMIGSVEGPDLFEMAFRAVESYTLKDDGLQLYFNDKKGCLYFNKH